MNILKKTLISAAFAAGIAASTQASAINVGGVEWDPNSPLDFSSFSIAIRQFIDPTSGIASGYGIVSTINGTSAAVFAPGQELTFQFGNYTPTVSNALPTTPGQVIGYNNGFLNLYIDDTPEISNPSDPLSLTAANTGDGNLWLSALGHLFSGSTLTGTVNGGATISGLTGVGLLDVIGGLAAANFDTNTQQDGADLRYSTSFTLLFPQNNPLNAAGTGNFFGDSIGIPEPASLALVGLGLLGIGALRRRKAAK